MRVMIAGLEEPDARALLAGLQGLAESGGILETWLELEEAVNEGRPDVVALYLGDRPSKALEMATRVRALFPSTRVVALSDEEEGELVTMVANAGCSDLALLSLGPQDLRRAVQILSTRTVSSSRDGTCIAVLGAKGGVGTTTVAINLAAEITALTKQRVVVVDLHTYLGDVAALLDISPEPTVLWFLGRSGPDANWESGMPLHRAGFRVLGLDGDLAEADRVTAQQVVHLVDRLRENHDWVILDIGSNLTEVSLAACTAADTRLVVVTEELPAVLGARRRLFTLRSLDLGSPLALAVVNRFHTTSKVDKQAVEGALGVPLVGVIANAYQEVHTALERANLIRETAPKSRVAQDYLALAEQLAGKTVQEEKKKKNFFGSLWKS